jgi:cbb3-type cytochrome oxidase subunit 3
MTETQIGMAVLVAFAGSFLGICVWALWPANRSRLTAYGRIPLEEDKDDE